MLRGNWREADTFQASEALWLHQEDCDAKALLIVMNIIHGKTSGLQKFVTLEQLAKIAVIVDLYECNEAVDFFVRTWLAELKPARQMTYSRDTVLWICVSQVFRHQRIFVSATHAALKYSKGPVQDLGLPIAKRIIGA